MKKYLVVLVVAVLLIIIVGAQIVNQTADWKTYTNTYPNAPEKISLKYPADWTPITSMSRDIIARTNCYFSFYYSSKPGRGDASKEGKIITDRGQNYRVKYFLKDGLLVEVAVFLNVVSDDRVPLADLHFGTNQENIPANCLESLDKILRSINKT